MTNEQIQKVFHKAVAMCDESGFHADSLVQTVGYHRKKNAFATCYTRHNMFGDYSNIKVSKYYAEKASEHQMLNTLVHEVLHACFPRENHGGKWAKAAAVMNKKYGLDISRCADYKDENGESILHNERPLSLNFKSIVARPTYENNRVKSADNFFYKLDRRHL